MARARINGDFHNLERRVRRGLQEATRNLTLETVRQVKRENPVDTGRSRAAWTWRFDAARLRGIVGNNVWYIRPLAEEKTLGGYTIRPKRAKALRFKAGGKTVFATRARIPRRRNKHYGFHKRGAEKAMKRAQEFALDGLRKAGVPIR